MSRRHFSFLITILGTLFCLSVPSCIKEQEDPTVSVTSVTISKETPGSFVITTPKPWTSELIASDAGDDLSWIQVSPMSGEAGSTTISVAATDDNINVGDRSAIVRISSCGMCLDVTVTQAQTDAMYVSVDTVMVSNLGGRFTVGLQHNVDYEVTVPDWITHVVTRALDVTDELFEVGENTADTARTAAIYFISASSRDSVTVVQPPMSVLTVSPDTIQFRFTGGQATAKIASNLQYHLMEETVPSWAEVMLDAAAGVIEVKTEPNPDHTARSAGVVLCGDDADIRDTLTVIQALKPDYPFLDENTFGVYDVEGYSWKAEPMNMQMGLKGYRDSYSFRLLYPLTSTVVEVSGLGYSYEDDQKTSVSVKILAGEKVVDKSYKVTVLKQDGDALWMRSDSGECFIVKTFEGR